MSLNNYQVAATKQEFQKNLELSNLSISEIANDLHTTVTTIENTLALNVYRIEDPWIVKNYLEEKIIAQGKKPIPFTALTGDYHHHWFLNAKRIDQRKLG
jgi:hypothetical protein